MFNNTPILKHRSAIGCQTNGNKKQIWDCTLTVILSIGKKAFFPGLVRWSTTQVDRQHGSGIDLVIHTVNLHGQLVQGYSLQGEQSSNSFIISIYCLNYIYLFKESLILKPVGD